MFLRKSINHRITKRESAYNLSIYMFVVEESWLVHKCYVVFVFICKSDASSNSDRDGSAEIWIFTLFAKEKRLDTIRSISLKTQLRFLLFQFKSTHKRAELRRAGSKAIHLLEMGKK